MEGYVDGLGFTFRQKLRAAQFAASGGCMACGVAVGKGR